MHFVLFVLTSLSAAVPPGRMVVEYDSSRGLPAGRTAEVVQDGAKRLYVSSGNGVLRFDGRRWTRVGGEGLGIPVWELAPAADGVWARRRTGDVWRVQQDTASRVVFPDSVQAVRAIASTSADHLLIGTDAGELWHQGDDWTQLLVDQLLPDERVHNLRRHGSYVSVLTSRGVFELKGTTAVRKVTLASTRGLVDAVVMPDGSTWVQPWWGTMRHYSADGVPMGSSAKIDDRGISVVRRGEILIASYANHLMVRDGTGVWTRYDHDYGGTLWVDHEGSTWIAGPGGVFQWPEFDTTVMDERQGLVSPHVRWLSEAPGGVWVSTWAGVQRVTSDGATVASPRTAMVLRDGVCTGSDGRSWTHGLSRDDPDRAARLLEISAELQVVQHTYTGVTDCAVDPDGSVWLSAADAWIWVPVGGPPTPVVGPPLEHSRVLGVDAGRRVWAVQGDRVCFAGREQVLDERARWTCTRIDGARVITDLLSTSGAETWVSTENAGVHRLQGATLRPIVEARAALGSLHITSMSHSARGGVWITGSSPPTRLDARSFQVLEQLGRWQGLSIVSAGDLLEDADETVWIATSRGVIRVPKSARNFPARPPEVQVDRVVVDGVSANKSEIVRVPASAGLVELDFAAASFRDPGRVRYRITTQPGGVQELDVPRVRLFELPSGPVKIQLRASLDGVRWTAEPARVELLVARPWWRHPAVWLAAALASCLLAFSAYRARVSYLLAQEKQRLRIAMDLHDEIGSGLGSVGLLAGVLARDDLDGDERRALVERVTGITAELGGSLHDIVWSLRPGGATLRSLMTRLTERGHDLFVGEQTRFEVHGPVPALRLSLPVRRNLECMCQEALHNAARHGRAKNVSIGVDLRGARPCVWVRDDGLGFDSTADSDGLGLESLRRRARRIGATLQIDSAPGEGTTVRVTFRPLAVDHREANR